MKNVLPLGPPAGLKPSAVPDLSGAWVRGGPIQTISNTDVNAERRGKEDDIPYQPWALQKMLSEIPPTGPFAEPHRTTDPWTQCQADLVAAQPAAVHGAFHAEPVELFGARQQGVHRQAPERRGPVGQGLVSAFRRTMPG